MKDRPDYHESIRALIRLAHKAKDAPQAVYYSQALNLSACASWETFKGAWCFDSWQKQHAAAIAAQVAEYKRFAYLS
jgi:hypothetical protein